MKTIFNIIILIGSVFSILGLIQVGFRWIWVINLIIASIYVIRLITNKEQTPMDKIVEGEDIKLVNEDEWNGVTTTQITNNHKNKYLLLCEKDEIANGWLGLSGIFVEKEGDNFCAILVNPICKQGNDYTLYQYSDKPMYILHTNDNGKIIEVKHVQE